LPKLQQIFILAFGIAKKNPKKTDFEIFG